MQPPAVFVGEAVLVGKAPRAEQLSGFVQDVRIRGERHNGLADEIRRFRLQKMDVFRRGIP
jgi:hypothetical protein